MGEIIGKDFKYKLVKNFLTAEELELLKTYTIVFHKNNLSQFDGMTKLWETSEYGSPLIDSLMMCKLPKMEEITGKSLSPTYTFWRMYIYQSYLHKHTDRPSCEISVTICLGSDKPEWPIYVNGNPIVSDPGDAVIYLGCELEHWREKFEGDWSSHVFMHYVDKKGPHKDHVFDKRDYIGKYHNGFSR